MARPSDRGRYKYGVCTNRDKNGEGKKCPKCECGEVQKVRAGDDFVCNECKEPLRQVPEPKKGMNLKLVISTVIAIIVIGGGIATALYVNGADNSEEEGFAYPPAQQDPPVAETDTLEKVMDTLMVTQNPLVDSIAEIKEDSLPTADEKIQETDRSNDPTFINLGYATYEGPQKNGKPHGIGGKLTFKTKHTIDLKKVPAAYLDVQPGEYMENVKFDNGRLIQGELHRKDGTRKWIHI